MELTWKIIINYSHQFVFTRGKKTLFFRSKKKKKKKNTESFVKYYYIQNH